MSGDEFFWFHESERLISVGVRSGEMCQKALGIKSRVVDDISYVTLVLARSLTFVGVPCPPVGKERP